MCNRLPEIKKSGDAGMFPVYYSLKVTVNMSLIITFQFENRVEIDETWKADKERVKDL